MGCCSCHSPTTHKNEFVKKMEEGVWRDELMSIDEQCTLEEDERLLLTLQATEFWWLIYLWDYVFLPLVGIEIAIG